jgi:pyruvate kinase
MDGVPHTKIIATLGPACWTVDGIQALTMAGADAFRINCSHAAPEAVSALVRRVRQAAPHAAVLVDLQGPKLRTHDVDITLETGDVVTLAFYAHPLTKHLETALHIPLGFDLAALGCAPQQRVLINDGRVELLVDDVANAVVRARVIIGGRITSKKGVNLPDTNVTTSPITPKDELDIRAARTAGADWLALSFVQSPQDITDLRSLAGDDMKLLAKVERPQILDHLDELCALADGVMAARGDLGVEVPFELVPAIQQEIVLAATRAGTVSVCATEMLESMISESRPTRAETNDVATAVRDGFDVVMLSGETATGHDPANAVRAMARICSTYEHARRTNVFADENPQRAAVTAAAAALASRLEAGVIIALTTTGYSAELLSACRPPVNIIAATTSQAVCRALQLRWGVTPALLERPNDMDQAAAIAIAHVRDTGVCQPGDKVVLCASRSSMRSDADSVWVVTVPKPA